VALETLDPIVGEDTDLNHLTSNDKANTAHIVFVPPNSPYFGKMTPASYVTLAIIEGFPVTALCGHTWVPHRNPKSLPVCQECKDIYESDPAGHGDRDKLPDA
jgi:hypothetical protein